MREMVQSEFAEMAKAAASDSYNEAQIEAYMTAPDDSMEKQKEQFAIQSEAVVITDPKKENVDEKTVEDPENQIRWKITIAQEDEREKIKNEPKIFSNLVIEKQNELKIDSVMGDMK